MFKETHLVPAASEPALGKESAVGGDGCVDAGAGALGTVARAGACIKRPAVGLSSSRGVPAGGDWRVGGEECAADADVDVDVVDGEA